jgi:2-hydroxy-6-oxonona-2,4-dienedioate hydrolase
MTTFWQQLFTLPHDLRFVDAGGVSTRALRAGEGEPAVFLHGLSGHLETNIPTLAAHAEFFEVHAIDMLGHGYTARPDIGPYSTDRLAAHVIDYMDAVGIERAHIVGLSVGGWTAGYMASEYPERVLRTSMSVPVGNPNMDIDRLGPLLQTTTRAAVNSDDIEETRKRLRFVVTDESRITDELVDIRYGIYHQPGFREGLDRLLATSDPSFFRRDALTPERLAKIESEVLLLWAEEDPSGPDGGKYFRQHIPRSKLVEWSTTGHWPPFERPEDFAALNIAFLRKGLGAVTEGHE